MGKDKLQNGINHCKLTGSHKTQYNHRVEATRFVDQLRENGYGVQKWENVNNKHVASVVDTWRDKGLTDKTIKEYLSGMRKVAYIYGNERISKSNADFNLQSTSVNSSNATDKSANENNFQNAIYNMQNSNNIDIQKISVQVEYMRYLGLRSEEARKLDAINSEKITAPDGTKYLHIQDGTKGGKERFVPINEKAQAALDKGAAIQRETGAKNLMSKNKSERKYLTFLYKTAKQYGLTRANNCNFHSLRHSFAQDLFKEKSGGYEPPIKENTQNIPDKNYEAGCRAVEKALGHNTDRSDIRGTYIGAK